MRVILQLSILLLICVNCSCFANPSTLQTLQTNTTKTLQKAGNKISTGLSTLTPDQSVLEERMQQEHQLSENLFGITFYKPTYILPFYYTFKPYAAVYQGNTPDDQKVMKQEFKAQLSIKFPVIKGILGHYSSLNLAYTQLNYWQVYAKSQYFRETNYQPEIFLSKQIAPNWWTNLGIEHQSNGRGGDLERSWNRTYFNLMFANDNWVVNLKPWLLIFTAQSSKLHNSDIEKYMGHSEFIFSYKIKRNTTLSLMLRNNLESGFKRGAVEIDCSFPIYHLLKGYVQAFSGYGQSLIEYNHFTNAIGVGIALSDWI
jgi:phospholipase A1/A2